MFPLKIQDFSAESPWKKSRTIFVAGLENINFKIKKKWTNFLLKLQGLSGQALRIKSTIFYRESSVNYPFKNQRISKDSQNNNCEFFQRTLKTISRLKKNPQMFSWESLGKKSTNVVLRVLGKIHDYF